MSENIAIDVGDHVHHNPTGEDWVVALVEDGELYWVGYPFGGFAQLSDCILIRKDTGEGRDKLLKTLADSRSDEKPCRRARERLEQL